MKGGQIVYLILLLGIVLGTFMVFGDEDFSLEGQGDEEKKTSEERGIIETPVTSYSGYTAEDPDLKDDTDTLTIPPVEEGEEPSYTQLEGEFTGTVKTEYGEAEGTFSNMVVGNGGLYEATITGIAAGTTVYFLSSFDDQLFKLKAGSDESGVHIIQFQKNGSSQKRVYMDLAEGDKISQGSFLEEMKYHFEAYDDNSVYIYNQDDFCIHCKFLFY